MIDHSWVDRNRNVLGVNTACELALYFPITRKINLWISRAHVLWHQTNNFRLAYIIIYYICYYCNIYRRFAKLYIYSLQDDGILKNLIWRREWIFEHIILLSCFWFFLSRPRTPYKRLKDVSWCYNNLYSTISTTA